MNVITQRGLIENIVNYWNSHLGPFPRKLTNSIYDNYYQKKNVKGTDDVQRTFEEVWIELKKLNLSTCSPEDVEKIMGKGNLVRVICNECMLEVDKAVEFYYDVEEIHICKKCLMTAISLI